MVCGLLVDFVFWLVLRMYSTGYSVFLLCRFGSFRSGPFNTAYLLCEAQFKQYQSSQGLSPMQAVCSGVHKDVMSLRTRVV